MPGGYDLDPLPIHAPPRDGESTVSWLRRVSARYDVPARELLRTAGGKRPITATSRVAGRLRNDRSIARRLGLNSEETSRLVKLATRLSAWQYVTSMENTNVHVPQGGGALVNLGGLGVHFKVGGEMTGGRFAVVEHPIEPGILVDPHVHRNENEMSFVLDGTIWARVGDQEVEAVAGSYVWKPRGVLHTFWNPGPEPARILEVISPAGFERLFEQIAELMG